MHVIENTIHRTNNFQQFKRTEKVAENVAFVKPLEIGNMYLITSSKHADETGTDCAYD